MPRRKGTQIHGPEPRSASTEIPRRSRRGDLLVTVSTLAGIALITISSLAPGSPARPIASSVTYAASPLHRMLSNVIPRLPSSAVAATGILGAVMLSAAFLAAVHHAGRGTLRLATVVACSTLAGTAVALLPLIGSRDVFSYLIQGRIVAAHGLNPYVTTPAELPNDPLLPYVDPMWRARPAPYGPLSILLTTLVARLGDPAAAIVWLKLAAWAACFGTLLLVIAARRRMDPEGVPMAAVLVGLNPIVTLSVVGAGHNDGLVALAIAGAAACAATRRPAERGPLADAATVALLACAALVKPAAGVLLVPAVAARWRRPGGRNTAIARMLWSRLRAPCPDV